MPGFKTFKQGQLLAKDKIRLWNKFNIWETSKIKILLLFVPSKTKLNNKVLKVCFCQRKLSAAKMSGEVQGLQIWSNLQSCTFTPQSFSFTVSRTGPVPPTPDRWGPWIVRQSDTATWLWSAAPSRTCSASSLPRVLNLVCLKKLHQGLPDVLRVASGFRLSQQQAGIFLTKTQILTTLNWTVGGRDYYIIWLGHLYCEN